MGAPADQAELARRAAVLGRLKDLLGRQRERLRGYLALLEKQEAAIGSGVGERILACAELEEQAVAGILSVQRAINPLEEMSLAFGGGGPGEIEIPALQASLAELAAQARARSAKNRGLLSARMAKVRAEADALKGSPFAKSARSVYGAHVAASLIDVRG